MRLFRGAGCDGDDVVDGAGIEAREEGDGAWIVRSYD